MYEVRYNMYPFRFYYKREAYFVVAFILTDKEREKYPEYQYALFRFVFMKRNDLDDTYELFINKLGVLEYNLTELRRYFGIDYDPNGFEFMKYF